ncbi:hypothetical protein [Komagataeibacter kakiaceti]|uniref:hypothetical protein n=1 Tax=Komagataeibacter kakiaceti TaxID=943261 RepID=UPI00047214C4|nr:hypothetical protein [Komagataeibacter kakiaceti]
MIDRALQARLLRCMAENGGAANLRPPREEDEAQYAKNLMDLELQGLCKGGVTISGNDLRITGESTLTNAGRAYLDQPDEMHVTLNGSQAIRTLRQRIADEPDLTDAERQELGASLDTMHPLALRALGEDVLARALERSPDAIPLLKKHATVTDA